MALYIQETGSANAPTIVFLHGGGGAGWMWQPQVEQLSDFHCLVPDLPEQGQSSAEKPFSISGSASLIADLIRTRAHGGRAFVVGLSEGAQITVALLSQSPELVERAIVSSALVRSMPGAWLLTPGLIRLSYRWSVTPFKNNDWWVRVNMKYAAGVPEALFSAVSPIVPEPDRRWLYQCHVGKSALPYSGRARRCANAHAHRLWQTRIWRHAPVSARPGTRHFLTGEPMKCIMRKRCQRPRNTTGT